MAYGVIYKITNQINGKAYIGQTTTSLSQRMASRRRANTVIGKAIRKYGWENFSVEVLEECDMKEELNEREIFWIAALNCKTPNGYNRTDGGDGTHGCVDSDETRAKKSKSKIGHKVSDEIRAKLRAGQLGKKNSFFGKHHTKETRAAMSARQKGVPKSPEQVAKSAEGNRGKNVPKKSSCCFRKCVKVKSFHMSIA